MGIVELSLDCLEELKLIYQRKYVFFFFFGGGGGRNMKFL